MRNSISLAERATTCADYFHDEYAILLFIWIKSVAKIIGLIRNNWTEKLTRAKCVYIFNVSVFPTNRLFEFNIEE